jgi:hypothetical protein
MALKSAFFWQKKAMSCFGMRISFTAVHRVKTSFIHAALWCVTTSRKALSPIMIYPVIRPVYTQAACMRHSSLNENAIIIATMARAFSAWVESPKR